LNRVPNYPKYQFEIEKYLGQMCDNPYLNELEDELKYKKRDKLGKYLSREFVNKLSIDEIDYVLNVCGTDAVLGRLKEKLDEQTKDGRKLDLELIGQVIQMKDIYQKVKVDLKPTPLRISTMTACCNLGTTIDTKYFYKMFVPPKKEDIVSNEVPKGKKKRCYYKHIKETIIGCKAEDFPTKGFFEKDKKSNFFNSAALNVLIYDNKCINVKIFNNGVVQMTGVPEEEYGIRTIEIIIDLMKSIPDDVNTGDKIVEEKKRLQISNYRTVLINSDYSCGMEIQREHLAYILSEKYDLSVNFESENYPGVKLQYFWNKTNTTHEGKCLCENKCKGKGNGLEKGQCKKITISTFQSGKVIVTGARSKEQLNCAYDFINGVFRDNYEYICKKTKSIKEKIKSTKNSKNNKIVFLKKNDVTNKKIYQFLLNRSIPITHHCRNYNQNGLSNQLGNFHIKSN
jgi:TATA-box binding protein (TBP) (component of TFIID and TFIIIB)